MALDYKSVLDVYDATHSPEESLPSWSAKMKDLTGTDLYDAGLHDNLLKRGSARLDQLIEKTGIPQYGAEVGRDVGALVGNEAAGERIGRGSGRMLVNFAPLLIPGVGWGATAARLGGTALLSGAETYTETGSPAAGFLSGATAAALPKVADVAEQAIVKRLGARPLADLAGNIIRHVPETIPQKVGGAAAGQVAAAGLFGASGAGQELLAGEQPSSPFTTENLLALTLGQAPFALAHLGGRALRGKPAELRAAELSKTLDLSAARIALKSTKQEMDTRPPIDQIPDVEKVAAEDLTPEQFKTAQQTRLLLSQVRGEQVKVKDNPNLTNEQKVEQLNQLMQHEYNLTKQQEVESGLDTIIGNSILPETPRQEVLGRQVRINKTGSWRAIHVFDDPANPEELRGKVIGYSTKGEPNPVFGLQSQETGMARYSLPDEQWRTTKTLDEWQARFKKDDKGQPMLPVQDEPMSQEELDSYLHDLDNVENTVSAADTTGDLQKAVVDLNAVQHQNDLSPTNDASLKKTTKQLIDNGVNPDEAIKTAVKVATKRTARKIQASTRELERAAPPLTPEETADITARMGGEGFSVMTADKLSHAATDEDIGVQPVSDIVTDTAMSTAKSSAARAAFDSWEGREDTTYQKDFKDYVDLVENYGSLSKVPLEEAGKMLAERTGAVPWDKAEVQEFLNRPHVQEWGRELDKGLADQQSGNAAPVPPPVLNVAGRKGTLLKNERVNQIVEDFSQGAKVTDAFGGSGQLAQFTKGAGAKDVTLNIKDSQMRGVFDEIKHNTEDFANRVAEAVKPIVSNRDLSVPTVEGGGSIREYLDRLEQTDPTVALYIKQNLNAQGREVTGTAFTPTKVLSSKGLQELPERIRSFASQIDRVSGEDGWKIVANAQAGDKITVDPPYVGEGGRYTNTPKITVEKQLENYYQHLFPAAERGAQFVVFDVAEPRLMKALQDHGFTVEQVQRASRGGAETKPEFVATNRPESISIERAPKTVARADAPIWTPEDPRDVETMTRMGFAQGGRGMLGFLAGSDNPFFSSLAKDLAKFGDSLDRIVGNVRQIDNGGFTRRLPGSNYELSFSPSLLRSDRFTQDFSLAHELVHGLTLAELDNPTNVDIRNSFDSFREEVIGKLPNNLKSALAKALSENWYDKWGKREATFESLMPNGTLRDRDILYSLLSTKEFVAQGLSSRGFGDFLRDIKIGKETWFNRFTNLVRTLLGLGEKVSGTAFEKFLSQSDQLLDRGNYVSSFRNFSDRYFENLGLGQNYVNANTQRAMGLLLNNEFAASPEHALSLLRMGAGGIRSPEWSKAQRDVTRMFSERGDDAMTTLNVLNEVGHQPNQTGLLDLTDSLMLGEVTPDALDVLPEAATRFIFETTKDTQNIFGAIRAATLEQNKGVLNIAEPEFIHSIAKQTLQGIEKVLAQSNLHDMQVRDIQGLFNVTPDSFYQNVTSSPEVVPEWAHGEDKKTWGDSVRRFLEPIGQTARRIPEAAEAFARGWQLNANARKMMSESMKAFGLDLTTMQMTKETVKNFARALSEPRLVKAANDWIYENQLAGKRTGETRVIDSDDARIVNLIGHLNAKDRDVIEDIVNKHQISMQHMQEQILEKGLQIASTNGAVVVQSAMGGKLKDAVTLSDTLLRAFTADRSDPAAAAVADSQIQLVQQKMSPEGFLELVKFAQNAGEIWKTQKEWFNKNPAWSTAQRYGKFLVEFRKGGKTYVTGVDSRKEAESVAEGRPFKLSSNRTYDEDRPPILGPDAAGIVTRLRELEQNKLDILKNTGRFTPDDLAEISKYSSAEQFATEETYRGGVPSLTPPPRGLTKGAGELPWLRNHFSWVSKTSNYWSRQLLRAQARAHLLDPEIAQNEQLRRDLQTHYENILQPDSQTGRLAQRAAMTWFMGFNPASAMINGTQPFLTHVAELTSMSGKSLDSYRRVLGALKEIYSGGLTKGEWKDPEIAQLIHKASQDGELDYSMYDDQAAAQESIYTNYKRILSGNRAQTLGQRLSTLAGNASTAGMWMFKTVERINNMSALIASYRYYRESQPNLNPDQAYAKAVEFNHAVNFGGGRAQRPIGAFAGRGAFPRTAAMIATAMQSYNLGTTFQIARYIRSGFFRPEGVTPAEVYGARKAAVQMLGTQLAAAGVLGLPFVSGMLSVLNQAFPDLELNRKLREGMNAILGGDGENGHILSDISMTGAPSMLGWDLQSRLSMGNTVPGVSEINGFQPENLLGAPANLVSNFVKGGFKLAAGDPHAVDSFMPSALKKFEQLLRSGGQVLDYRNRPIFTPSLGEKVGIVLGFQPKRLSDYNAASRIATQADDNIKRREGQFHQQMAEEVLKGNFGTVRQTLLQRTREDAKYDPVQAVRSISSAAEELTFPRDLRREGTVRSSDVRGRLLATFNLPPSQPSETDRIRFRQGVQQRLGLMAQSPTDLQSAAMMDELRRQNPTASRSELRRQVSLLLHGRSHRNFSLLGE